MPSICFYFQVHQPYRIKKYRNDQIGVDHDYFDEKNNRAILQKVAYKCYLPMNRLLLEKIRQTDGRFKVSFSITGTAMEQLEEYCPEALASFVELAKTGSVEFLAETYYHSLAALYSPAEFRRQVQMHTAMIQEYFNQTPTVFRNTELVYNNDIGNLVSDLGYKAILAEGADDILGWRSPNFVYQHPQRDLKILTKNYKLSDDIAFRFSNQQWNEWPLTTEKFAQWVHRMNGNGDVVNLFMDYETFGEHQWADTGIFDFMRALPEQIWSHSDWSFQTPSEVLNSRPAMAPLSYERVVSWADMERDLTAWNGNQMQKAALERAHSMSARIFARQNPHLTSVWRKLLTSDHFYYICTKFFSDGDVHAYFSPFKNPYEGFMSYMNVLTDIEKSVFHGGPHSLKKGQISYEQHSP